MHKKHLNKHNNNKKKRDKENSISKKDFERGLWERKREIPLKLQGNDIFLGGVILNQTKHKPAKIKP